MFSGFFGFELKMKLLICVESTLLDDEVVVRLERLDRVRRHLLDEVELAALEGGEERVLVLEVLVADRVGVRLGAVVAGVLLEDRRALAVELGDDVRARADDREVVLGVELLETLAVGADVLLPDVLGEDEELLELREHVADRRRVLDHERLRVGRGERLHVGEEGREDRGRPVRVLEHGLARPHRVLGGERRSVRPLAGLQVEGPREPVLGRLPALGPVALPLELGAVLDEQRVLDDEGLVRLGVEGDEGVDGVDLAGRADAEDAALDRPRRRRRRPRSSPSRSPCPRSSPPPHEAAATTSARSARNHSTRFVISVSLSPSCQAGPLERERPRVRIQRRRDAERDGREVLPVAQGELV